MNYSHVRVPAFLALAGLLCVPIAAFAAEFRTGDQPSLPAGEVVNEDLYMVGGNVTSAGSVRGDLIAGGGTVIVNGAVSSDLLVGGGNVTILGDVGDDVRVAGGNILIQGSVGGDVVVGGGQVNLSGSRIGGDVAVGGGMVRLDAPVSGDVRIAGGQVNINSTVNGNVEIHAEEVTLGPKAVIHGNLTYSATKEVILEEGAIVRGETNFTEQPDVRSAAKAGLLALASFLFVSKFLMMLVGAFTMWLMFRRFSVELVQTAAAKPLPIMGRGLIFLIVTPIVSVALLFTIVGIPLGAVGLLAFAAAMIAVSLASPIVLGSIVHTWIFKPAQYEISWKTILLGVVLYFLIGLIPFIGGLALFALLLLVLGAAMKIKWDAAKEWR
ncbi:hypothetical protein COU18_03125 [Candidatus Kaiserbacteria bacterium CG10_big_fil_rev_8_21_14_0_10_51_14]|uniref:DUF8173 domain-containing protein n=1 Tax=Candidatus Kaiserbacteria bacterium CG10_big_fil_rev_8_21_14_0_10_51_14 TaxID=1974610 RepID=A0A2H0UB65_9BACT|nr:MAG: hypothetical protein COU18_03125 [Candidatus Kaiserbacteria bacterium CG10_big_fil_rev_8_21_14_0_10_51_14]